MKTRKPYSRYSEQLLAMKPGEVQIIPRHKKADILRAAKVFNVPISVTWPKEDRRGLDAFVRRLPDPVPQPVVVAAPVAVAPIRPDMTFQEEIDALNFGQPSMQPQAKKPVEFTDEEVAMVLALRVVRSQIPAPAHAA